MNEVELVDFKFPLLYNCYTTVILFILLFKFKQLITDQEKSTQKILLTILYPMGSLNIHIVNINSRRLP